MANASIGIRLREARKELRLTQSKLAEDAGISVSYLNLIEHNKRAIGGALLNRLASRLGLDVTKLSGQEDARLIQQLGELSSEPLLQDIPLSEKGAQSVVSREPDWARATIRLHNAWRSNNELIEALSDQLNRDPYVLETSHEILTQITSVRSFAEILDDHKDLPEPQRAKFTSMLAEESEKLGNSARALFSFMGEREQESRPTTPAGEVDEYIIDHNNYFPELEGEASRLFEQLQHSGYVDERALVDQLAESCELDVSYEHFTASPSARRSKSPYFVLDEDAGRLVLNAAVPHTTQRFQLARILFARLSQETINALVGDAELHSDEARDRAFHALARYGAGALFLPYDQFLKAAEELRYDIQMLMTRFSASFEQICHRLVTLRRPGANAVPFAFMRTDLAGNTSKRFSLAELRLPRHGSACPLWAIYNAFLTPDRIVTQLARMPDGRQFLFLARAISKEASSFGVPRQIYSIMLACNASYAKRLVYGDQFASVDQSQMTEVGVSCRLCSRSNCQQRAYAQVLPKLDATH